MDRLDRRRFLALASLMSLSGLTLGVLTGCGGGSGNGGTVSDTRGTVALPSGFPLPLSELSVQTGLGGKPLISTAQFAVPTITGNLTLAWLQHSSSRASLLGFIDPSRTDNVIDSASTAVALLYMVLGGFRLPEDRKGNLVDLLRTDTETAKLAEVVAQRTTANPFALEDGDTVLGTALKTSYDRILSGTRAAAPTSAKPHGRAEEVPALLLLEPSGEQSGVEVLQGTATQSLFATNHYRRRCQVRIYQVGTQEADNLPSYYDTARPVGEALPLSSTGALGIFSTITALVNSGSTAFVPVSTPPVTLTPSSASKTLFEVVVLGSAFTLQEPAFFSDAKYSNEVELWRSTRLSLNVASWLADIIFGLFLELWGLRDIVKNEAAIQAAIQAFEAIELDSVRALLVKAGKAR
ncbi:MAG: hypothetical protein QM758_23555 [Armatimonas sp.]